MKNKKKDKSAIQTLFRTASKNHYTLIQTNDRKASIVLTINSILISLILGSIYLTPTYDRGSINLIAHVTIYSCLLSMIFALLSILPHKYGKQKSLIYAGATPDLSKEDFRTQFNDLISSGQSIYDTMIDDLYHIGKCIRHRQFLVRCSVAVIIIGTSLNLFLSIFIMKGHFAEQLVSF